MNYCCCTPQIHCRYCQKSGKEFRNIKPFFKLNDKDNETFMNKHTHPPVPTAQPKEPEQKPVAFLTNHRQRMNLQIKPEAFVWMPTTTDWEIPLYTTPPQRTWVGLTHSDIDQGLLRSDYAFKTAEAWRAGVVFAITKLKEKNQ